MLVISARGERNAGTIGDILVQRTISRGAAGIVTDGAVRDFAAVADLDIPVYSTGGHPAPLGRHHVAWDTDVAVDCAGALVEPGDLLVGDGDGVVVLPDDVVADVVDASVQQETRGALRPRAGAWPARPWRVSIRWARSGASAMKQHEHPARRVRAGFGRRAEH